LDFGVLDSSGKVVQEAKALRELERLIAWPQRSGSN